MENWYIVNEKIFTLEKIIRDQGLCKELQDEWDTLIISSRKIAGCVRRYTYEEIKKGEEGGNRENVEGFSGYLDEKKA